jgi:conjugative transfer signal peptidase TraF
MIPKLVALVVIAVIASLILFGNRLIVNRTHSLPVGLYYRSDVRIKKGSIVLFKPDQNTPLDQLGIERGYEERELPLLKHVVALAGDVVSVSSSGVSINGQLLPNSAPLFHDESGRPLAMAQLDHFKLGTDEAFLMGVNATSWDSRYFGPVLLSRCSGSFVPVLTWP